MSIIITNNCSPFKIIISIVTTTTTTTTSTSTSTMVIIIIIITNTKTASTATSIKCFDKFDDEVVGVLLVVLLLVLD